MKKLDLKIKLNHLQNNGLFSTIKEAQKAEKYNQQMQQLKKQKKSQQRKKRKKKFNLENENVSSEDEDDNRDDDDSKLLDPNPYTLLIPQKQQDKQFVT